jgi:hypothetical protein
VSAIIIQAFEESLKPFGVIYGDVPDFEKILEEFRIYFLQNDSIIYLAINMSTLLHSTPSEIAFYVIQQLGGQLLDILPESSEKNEFTKTMNLLRDIRHLSRGYSYDQQLATFISFADFKFYPAFYSVCQSFQTIIIAFERFEAIGKWGSAIRNILFDKLLRKSKNTLRFLIFVQAIDKIRLFPGSNEDADRKNIWFFKVAERYEMV